MQKYNSSFLIVLVLMTFSLVFAGCKKDDDATLATKALLTTGTWKGVNYRVYSTAGGKTLIDSTESLTNTTKTFSENGTVVTTITDGEGNKTSSTGAWTLSNDKKLTIISLTNPSYYTIKEISSTSLVLSNSGSYTKNGVTSTAEQTATYSK
ncbi:lipocalin family protein [Xanthocytophaga agilis]|uniref:Lipocalin family protein n=1 Tax=Xanthocytophaga agilis TaxID=3048010 RepID=A0AAE3R856_9BACT|nr:lipocalin family protein [Xanthocytophaga agilis]MDJ1505631.1 lipocalin family protein [Xanthocytophaga agilis]